MGAIDLVVQIESPPSAASGLQRVGRAGHIVGAASTGIFYPKHRADLVNTAVTVQRMQAGLIEEIRIPTNALDVLLQHTIAAVSVADWDVEQWFETVTRAYPYHNLDREVFDAVINLASGSYPSTDFAELPPPHHLRSHHRNPLGQARCPAHRGHKRRHHCRPWHVRGLSPGWRRRGAPGGRT